MAGIPKIFKISEPTRKKCKLCDRVIRPNDIVMDYISSSYGGKENTAWLHLGCMINSAPKDCEFEVVMQALAHGAEGSK